MPQRLMALVGEFHRVFGHPMPAHPQLAPKDRADLRIELIREEFAELVEAIEKGDIVAVADALGDLAYVVAGAAHEYGIPLDAVIEEIHDSNMSKVGPDGRPIKRADGKTLKGPHYRPPNIVKVLERSLRR